MTKITKREYALMGEIANSALTLYAKAASMDELRSLNMDDKLTVMMDLEAAHNCTPLNFVKLLNFDDANFAHDMFGIRRHMNRVTGQLEGCFLPRCAIQ